VLAAMLIQPSTNSKTKRSIMKQLTLLLALTTIISCNQTSVKSSSTTPINIDSLTATFNAGWNNKDSAAIMKTIADNAILRHGSSIYKGHSAIANKWVSDGVKFISNLTTSSLMKDSDDKIAYDGGTFTHNISIPGQPLHKTEGNYNFVWIKQQNGEWKLKFIHVY
jgi:ketosteroid isomerase-like protein